MATTRAGAPSMIARVRRLRVSTSRLRRQSTAHCRTPTDQWRTNRSRFGPPGSPAVLPPGARGERPRDRRGTGRTVGRHAGVARVGHQLVDLGDEGDAEERERVVGGAMEGQTATAAEHHDAVAVRRSSGLWVVNATVVPSPARRPSVLMRARAVPGSRPGGRLVEEEGAGPGQELDGDADPLALAAAERTDPHRGAVEEVEGLQGVLRRRRRWRRGRSSGSRRRAA